MMTQSPLFQWELRDPVSKIYQFLPNPSPFRLANRMTVEWYNHAAYLEVPMANHQVTQYHPVDEESEAKRAVKVRVRAAVFRDRGGSWKSTAVFAGWHFPVLNHVALRMHMDLFFTILPQLPDDTLDLMPFQYELGRIVTQSKGQCLAKTRDVALEHSSSPVPKFHPRHWAPEWNNSSLEHKAERVLQVLHCYAVEKLMRVDLRLPEMAVKAMMALPRFVDVIPAEKAYYDAGMAARREGSAHDVAFHFLYRFTDLRERIEEGERDSSTLDNTDFAPTDFPFNFALTRDTVIPEHMFEQANQWILAKAIEAGSALPDLPTINCPQTGVKMFEGALRSPAGPLYDPCAITGYPILGESPRTNCNNCNRPANQEDWNRFVLAYKKCPWCGTAQTAVAGSREGSRRRPFDVMPHRDNSI